ncbi:MAG: flagellar export protein FliJ [Spirochaetes bacterium]|nr:flagellar export protein FliJ [Spirochaetota bacterium]MBU1081729.1 flagellar export protein FliJ [Spirochaetota bacterium]
MKRFSFGLEKVLELRDYAKRVAEARLAEKSAACERLALSLEANAGATLAASRERFRPGTGAADHRASELYAVRLSQERDRLMKAAAMAEAQRETSRLAYVEASKSREIVSKLREREEAAYYKAVGREETKSMDDLASGAHSRAMGAIHTEKNVEGYHGIVR